MKNKKMKMKKGGEVSYIDRKLSDLILSSTSSIEEIKDQLPKLLDDGANINFINDYKYTLLDTLMYGASYNDRVEKIKILLDNGANIELTGEGKPLMEKLENEIQETKKALDYNIKNNTWINDRHESNLRLYLDNFLKIKEILQSHKKGKAKMPDKEKVGLSPRSQKEIDEKLFELFKIPKPISTIRERLPRLLERGANINYLDDYGEFILSYVIDTDDNPNLDYIEELFDLILQNGFNVNTKNSNGQTISDIINDLYKQNQRAIDDDFEDAWNPEDVKQQQRAINQLYQNLLEKISRYAKGKQKAVEAVEKNKNIINPGINIIKLDNKYMNLGKYTYNNDKAGPSRKSDEAGPSRKPDEAGPSRKPDQRNIELKVVNPLTNRYISIGSKKYKELVESRVIKPVEIDLNKAKQLNNPVEKCKEVEVVVNPLTGRKIQKYGKLYSDLVKRKIITEKEHITELPKFVPRNCKNKETFMLFSNVENINDVPNEDFLQLPSGYCFSISELIDWLNSKAFNNKNPHESKEDLFKKEDLTLDVLKKSPELTRLLKEYFDEHQKKIISEIDILHKHIDVLYKICDTGRICYFDNSTSTEQVDSSTFAYSIRALTELSEMINALPLEDRNIFNNLKVGLSSLSDIIKSANEGTACIHGIGKNLIEIFIVKFISLYDKYKIDYDPNKSGLYFIKDRSNVNMYNRETRLIINTNNYYYEQQFKNIFKRIKDKQSSMIWTLKKIREQGLSSIYSADPPQGCPNDSDISTLNALDKWSELEDWRKFRTEDGFCFDLLYLIRVLTDQLNTTSMTNPYPKYPTNIFTNKKLSNGDLLKLRIQISNNYLTVAPPLLKFLYNPEILWTDINIQDWRTRIIELFEKDMRYRREFNSFENGDLSLTCMWIEKNTRPVESEIRILRYLENANENELRNLRQYTIPMSYYFKNNYLESSISPLLHGYNDYADLPMR